MRLKPSRLELSFALRHQRSEFIVATMSRMDEPGWQRI
jgi:hypothetical protein